MRQVLDLFNLLEGDELGQTRTLVWQLLHASTNSPFTAVGEAVSLVTDVDIAVLARAQKYRLKTDLDAVQLGVAGADFERSRIDTVKNIMFRNVNGIGLTEIDFLSELSPIRITAESAKSSIYTLESKLEKRDGSEFGIGKVRREFGAVEGIFLDVGMHYNKPAIRIIERRTRSAVWCLIENDTRQSIVDRSNYDDVWERRRVKVKGKIEYDALGQIARIYASNIEKISPRRMILDDIFDPNFTQGIPTEEYLSLLREGELADRS